MVQRMRLFCHSPPFIVIDTKSCYADTGSNRCIFYHFTSHKKDLSLFKTYVKNRPYVLAIYSLSCCSKSIVLLITSSKRTVMPSSIYVKGNDGNKYLPSLYLLYYFTNMVPRPSSVNSSIRMACGISPLMINTFLSS